jgi:predicted RNase H-like nuclease
MLKHHEDRPAAALCAVIAWYWWRRGAVRTEVFGNLEAGYILVPTVIMGTPAKA